MLMEQKAQKRTASAGTREILRCPILPRTGRSPAAAALAQRRWHSGPTATEGSLPWKQLRLLTKPPAYGLILIPSQSWNGMKEAALRGAPRPVCFAPEGLKIRGESQWKLQPQPHSAEQPQSVQSPAMGRPPTSVPNPAGSPLPQLKIKPGVCHLLEKSQVGETEQ